MNGKLYLVATPIGNLDDITLRAIKILKDVDIIAAEDTRHSLKLLNHLEISKPLISYHRHNEEIKSELLIDKLINGENIAIVTDAGTPAISDPGEFIVKKAIENNIDIIPIPGACALINALICSGLDTKEFAFYGFLPLNKKLRCSKFNELKKENKTAILYEAPHKIESTLEDIYNNLGDKNIVLARELTKIHETFLRGRVSEIINLVHNIKGEIIILIEGNINNVENNNNKDVTIEEQYEMYKREGLTKNEIIKKIAKNVGVKKNDIYMKFLDKD